MYQLATRNTSALRHEGSLIRSKVGWSVCENMEGVCGYHLPIDNDKIHNCT